MSVKINSFEIENCKRIKMLTYEPTPTGLTLIGGKTIKENLIKYADMLKRSVEAI